MKYSTVCSGIEAASVAYEPLGWEPVWFSEIEKFPNRVLAHHYPHVPNLGDMTKLDQQSFYEQSDFDVLIGGTPCQDFSIAGLRAGLDGERGNLSLSFVDILKRKRPKWFKWENVPGVFSSNGGKDFAAILSAFTGTTVNSAGLGTAGIIQGEFYSVAWRVLDSQYFGVPQRRRRVFVVGHLGNDWRPPAAVLFERESLCRDFTPSRKEGETIAGTITKRSQRSCSNYEANQGLMVPYTKTSNSEYSEGVGTLRKKGGDIGGGSETLITKKWSADLACTLNTVYGTKQGLEDQHVNAGCPLFVPYRSFQANAGAGAGIAESDQTPTLDTTKVPAVYSIQGNMIGRKDTAGPAGPAGPAGQGINEDISFTQNKTDVHAVAYSIMPMNSGKDYKAREVEKPQPLCANGSVGGNQGGDLIVNSIVRRLTPVECARLQGFSDNYLSQVPGYSDSAAYAALGNSMTTNVMAWIGGRIDKVQKILDSLPNK